jgi:hypothetical protein
MRKFQSQFLSVLILLFAASTFGQTPAGAPKSGEISDVEGIPVIIKHLPDWENSQSRAVFATTVPELKAALGDRTVLDLVDFAGGTEAATAPYEAGRLLIVEYMNPQLATEADAKFTAHLAQDPSDPPVVYRRIGNYSAFVFDAADPEAAAGLLDQVKYEKSVQWLGKDPFLLEKFERYFAITGRDVALATVLWIVSGFASAIVIGVITGFIFFRYREKGRATQHAYSDAGGLTRLNLDGLSEPLRPE